MFDGLPDILRQTVPYLSYFVLVGGSAAVAWWWINRIRNYFSNTKSTFDD